MPTKNDFRLSNAAQCHLVKNDAIDETEAFPTLWAATNSSLIGFCNSAAKAKPISFKNLTGLRIGYKSYYKKHEQELGFVLQLIAPRNS